MKLLIALVALLAGCAQALRCPRNGGAVWRELLSEHVELRTDLDEWAARQALDELEVDAVRLGGLLAAQPPDKKVRATLFANEYDYRALGARESWGAHFSNSDAEGMVVIPVYGGWVNGRPMAREIWQHEYSHYLMHHSIPNSPVWLNEGVAELFESARPDEETHVVVVGRVISQVSPSYWPSVAELIAATPKEFYRDQERYYSAAWGLTYFLFRFRKPLFDRYLEALKAGQPSDEAWLKAGLDAKRIDSELRAEYLHDVPREWRLPNPPWPPHAEPKSERDLSDLEVHLLWARVCNVQSEEARRTLRAQLEEALLHTPGDETALAWLKQLDEHH